MYNIGMTFIKEYKPWNKGKKLSKEHIEKLKVKAKKRKIQNINTDNYKEIQSKARKIKKCLKCGKNFKQKSPADPDYHKKYSKIWNKNNIEKVKAKGIRHYRKYQQKVSWSRNKRNRLKRVAEGNHTFKEWENLKKKFKYTCQRCGKTEPFNHNRFKNLTEDHIIPLSKGGTDFINNIQPLCHSCNCKKSNKIT